ncbi:hypothetical protein [Glaciihabitans sp. UYNi722]|uniref:hypothetical protein n=1 Tax=Glaciihabitans sp. UYNi722 TaxID=3156344 RepID=UPI003397C3D2
MTGSGTTVFDAARVDPAHIIRLVDSEAHEHASVTALFQTVLMSALWGIGRADFSADSLTLAVASRLDAIDAARQAGTDGPELHTAAQIAAFKAQQIVLPTILEAATLLFEVGGASATSTARALDCHWRNARTIASHNPSIQREQALGDYALNGTLPVAAWVTSTIEQHAAASAL